MDQKLPKQIELTRTSAVVAVVANNRNSVNSEWINQLINWDQKYREINHPTTNPCTPQREEITCRIPVGRNPFFTVTVVA